MPDLQVVYDTTLQVGAIVDLDTNMGWGPICPGPTGGELLQAFINGMPFDITILTPEQARDIFLSVFRDQAAEAITSPSETDTSPVVTADGNGPTDDALATAEAVATAGAPPEPAPHDADMAADTSETATVTTDPTAVGAPAESNPVAPTTVVSDDGTTNCMLCNANGTGSNNPSCIVCGGSGKVRAA